MNPFDKKMKSLLEEHRVMPDAETDHRINDFLENLTEKPVPNHPSRGIRRTVVWTAAAVVLVCLLLPNMNPTIANAMQKIPVIGEVVKVITVSNYVYDDGGYSAAVKTPQIVMNAENSTGAGEISKAARKLTDRLIAEFQASAEMDGYGCLEVDYDIVTDTPDWFTLRMTVFEAAGSSDTYYKYYHIDRSTGKSVQLSDLFAEDTYVEAISENIREQMVAQMAADDSVVYFLDSPENSEWNFYVIDADQNFYFNEDGKLVIVYDKYETAPGYMGCPEFVVEKDVYGDYLLAAFQNS